VIFARYERNREKEKVSRNQYSKEGSEFESVIIVNKAVFNTLSHCEIFHASNMSSF
jgi:hypothetical protein